MTPQALRRFARPALACELAVLLGVAYACRFVQDDAFISFRYAEHWAGGHGLVWNIGEPPIEGFTNLIYTLLIGVFIRLGIDPVTASYAIGLASVLGTALATIRLSRSNGIVAVALLATNYSFVCYATGGLETQLQAALCTGSLALVFGEAKARPAWAGVLLGLAVWTRMDSALFGGAIGLFLLSSRQWRALAVFLGAFLSLLGALIAFKLRTFGMVLPNTFYAKASGLASLRFRNGYEFWLAWIRSYGLILPLALIALVAARRRDWNPASVAVLTFAIWSAYVVWVGGDFMEFRFFVPLFPVVVAGIAFALDALDGAWPKVLLVGSLALESMSFAHETSDRDFMARADGLETIRGLAGHIDDNGHAWAKIGRFFGDTFRGTDVTFAVGAAGAMPYYSKLRVVDSFGLNDKWIARNGRPLSPRPGHSRIAQYSYLASQRVNLVPWPRNDEADPLPHGGKIVDLVVAPNFIVPALYLVPNPAVDRAIEAHHWVVHEVP